MHFFVEKNFFPSSFLKALGSGVDYSIQLISFTLGSPALCRRCQRVLRGLQTARGNFLLFFLLCSRERERKEEPHLCYLPPACLFTQHIYTQKREPEGFFHSQKFFQKIEENLTELFIILAKKKNRYIFFCLDGNHQISFLPVKRFIIFFSRVQSFSLAPEIKSIVLFNLLPKSHLQTRNL